ncbi:hypothetical protein F4810DRAFT_714137 [Camillea tinctor]|nr:hypothetical protein F4810DRAFT_714137 [Camillea tinctor]
MIDGLDECAGDQSRLTELILDIANTTPNLKICVASRPWTNFEDSEGFDELRQRDPEYAEGFVRKVSNKAEGVFLWVYLVVNSLISGLTNGGRAKDLEARLAVLPPTLETLFGKILHSLEDKYFSHASQLFQLMVYCKAMKRKPMSRCRGLLEATILVSPNSSPLNEGGYTDDESDYTSDEQDSHWVPRNKKLCDDYIEDPEIWDWLVSGNDEPFDAYAQCAHWTVSFIKWVPEPSFMYLMAMCGMYRYISARSVQESNSHSLVFAATDDFLAMQQFEGRSILSRDYPSIRTVQALLEKGEDAHALWGGRSPWMLAERMAACDETNFEKILLLYLEFCGRPLARPKLATRSSGYHATSGEGPEDGIPLTPENLSRVPSTCEEQEPEKFKSVLAEIKSQKSIKDVMWE